MRRSQTNNVSPASKSMNASTELTIADDGASLQGGRKAENQGEESKVQSPQIKRSHTAPASNLDRDDPIRLETAKRLDEFLLKRNLIIPHHHEKICDYDYDLHSEMESFFKKIYDTKLPDQCKNNKPFDKNNFQKQFDKNNFQFDKNNFQKALDDFSNHYHVRITIQQIVQCRTLQDVYDSMRIIETNRRMSWDPVVDVKAIHYCKKAPHRRPDSMHLGFEHSTFAILEARDGTSKTGFEVEIAVGGLELKVRTLLHAVFYNCNQCGCDCCKAHQKLQIDTHESKFFANLDDAPPKPWETFCEVLDILKGSFKSLFWFVGVFFIIFCVESYYGIEKLVEDLFDKAVDDKTYTLPYFLIIIFVWLIRAANGPGVSKSLITSSMTILTCIFYPDADRWTVFLIVMPLDWLLDISLSLVQLAVAAPMMSTSLYVLFEIFQYFVYVFHWMTFVLWAVVLATKPDSTSDPAFWVCVMLFFYVIIHFIARLYYPRRNPENFLGRWFMVPHDLRGKRNHIVQDYDKVIGLYIQRNRSLVHAWSKFWHYHASYRTPWLLNMVEERSDDEQRRLSPEICIQEISYLLYFWSILWSLVYTIVSEMVILLDAVFLLIYDWRNLHGIMIIAVATAADVDRIYTIDAFYNFCQNGDLVDSASKIIWWKLFKMPIAWLICYMHAKWIGLLWGLLASELETDQDESSIEDSPKPVEDSPEPVLKTTLRVD